MRRAVITGITGQDGSYLAELLLEKGYDVWGLVRRASTYNQGRLKPALRTQGLGEAILPTEAAAKMHLRYGDVTEASSVCALIEEAKPHEVYNLAGMTQVGISYKCPEYTMSVNAMGASNVLMASYKYGKRTGEMPRFYQASSSEMFGDTPPPQNELSAFSPVSPYGVSKVAAYWATRVYRKMGMFACNGILFNHESPRRGETFLSRKVTRAVARIKTGLQDKVYLGNTETSRDWGYAKEYVAGIYSIMQHEKPDDFVICTGERHTVQEWIEAAFAHAGLNWQDHVVISDGYKRPLETPALQGVSDKARDVLGWKPKAMFHDVVALMVDADVVDAETEKRGRPCE